MWLITYFVVLLLLYEDTVNRGEIAKTSSNWPLNSHLHMLLRWIYCNAVVRCVSWRQLGGDAVPSEWGGISKLGDENDVITVEVNNVLTQKNISNVFGVIKGYVDPGTTFLRSKCSKINSRVWKPWISISAQIPDPSHRPWKRSKSQTCWGQFRSQLSII